MILRSHSGLQVVVSSDLALSVSDPLQMVMLRRLLYETSAGWRLDFLSDADVVQQVQQMLVHHELMMEEGIVRREKNSSLGQAAPSTATRTSTPAIAAKSA